MRHVPANQLSLLSDTPIARRKDPPSSKKAAAEITKSGLRAIQHNMVMAAVKEWPGRTSAELAHNAGWDRFMPARRLPELRAQGLVDNGEERKCAVTGRACITWWVHGHAK